MIEIACAAAEDAVTLAEIMKKAWCSAFRGILSDDVIAQYTQPKDCGAMFSRILASGEGTMYLAKSEDVPMGLLYWLEEGDALKIEALLTVPEAWGCGIGPALMEKAVSDAVALGKNCIRVWPFEQNARARRFYEKRGFVSTGAQRMSDALELEYVRDLGR